MSLPHLDSSRRAGLSPAFPGRAPWGTASSLRAWQAQAVSQYLETAPRDFLAVATPGAGKTTFALRIASELLAQRVIERVIVVTPTDHLKTQWAQAAARVGIQLDAGRGHRGGHRALVGTTVTYAGVSMRPWHYDARCANHKTLVIFDEIHHAGDARSWGEAISDAFELATRRLALTGTPFRSDDSPIPFVTYERGSDGFRHSVADYTYGYAEALRDHVVRPVVFLSYGGSMRWRTAAGDEVAAGLGEPLTKDVTAQAWRTALAPEGDWISAVLSAADKRLSEVRRQVPDAGGLVIATDQATARAYAQILGAVAGEPPTVVLSDDRNASAAIDEFREGSSRWLVAVRMVSEGVDVPRLAVGVYATATSTPLFFAQVIGRFVRARRRGELATVFLPNVPILLAHAAQLERERNHVLGEPKAEDWLAQQAANRVEAASAELLGQFEALASAAVFDHALFEDQMYGITAEPSTAAESDFLGLPGLLDTDQVALLLRERQRRQMTRVARAERAAGVAPEVATYRQLATARKELNTLVSQFARIRGVPHSHVHADLRRTCGGPRLPQCTQDQIGQRIAELRRWFAGK